MYFMYDKNAMPYVNLGRSKRMVRHILSERGEERREEERRE